jgi:hypothetical protein
MIIFIRVQELVDSGGGENCDSKEEAEQGHHTRSSCQT